MRLYEKIKNMTLEEVASTLVLMTIRDNDPIKEIATSTEELLQFMIEVLEQDVEDEDVDAFNEVAVHDVTIEDGRSKTINFEYFDSVLGDCVYSLEIGER
jgi:3-dehydroquinate dehydratase